MFIVVSLENTKKYKCMTQNIYRNNTYRTAVNIWYIKDFFSFFSLKKKNLKVWVPETFGQEQT